MSPTQFKVYVNKTGESKKKMLAQFAEYIDAINYAVYQSKGKYMSHGDESYSVKVIFIGKVHARCKDGKTTIVKG